MKKLVITLALLASLILMPFEGVSAHINPKNNLPCNNTGYTYSDYLAPVSHWTTTHLMGSGVCTINTFVYNHKMYCSSCTAYLGFGATYECTVNHTNPDCPSKKTCSGLNPTPAP